MLAVHLNFLENRSANLTSLNSDTGVCMCVCASVKLCTTDNVHWSCCHYCKNMSDALVQYEFHCTVG